MRRALSLLVPVLPVLPVLLAGWVACSRVEEPDPVPRPASASATAATPASAPGSASALGSASAPAPAPASASASASTSSSAATLSPTIFDGTWVFSRFDLTDPGTAAKWSALPADAQADVVANAPQATLILTKGTITTKLSGVADQKSTFTVASSASDKELVIATSDQGRKRLRLLNDGAMRVEDLDAKDSFVTIFVRKK
jgi:hypothetical protein